MISYLNKIFNLWLVQPGNIVSDILMHSTTGISTYISILLYLQPLLALCRCNPKSDKRPIFNWIHWFFGTIAAVLSSKLSSSKNSM